MNHGNSETCSKNNLSKYYTFHLIDLYSGLIVYKVSEIFVANI